MMIPEMNAAVGFTAILGETESMRARARAAQQRAISHFPDLKLQEAKIGETTLYWWGRGDLAQCAWTLPDQSMLLLTGSPVGKTSLETAAQHIGEDGRLADFRLPWEGRVNLLHISASGQTWSMWNDFIGSIPVYYAGSPRQRIASTLEPVVVEANHFTREDIFLPGVMFFFIHGHFTGDWTFFKEMKTAAPDSFMQWSERGVRAMPLCSIPVTADRWEVCWDDLIDEMHQLTRQAVLDAMNSQPNWILPLTSGLDSRLIAAIAARENIPAQAYTWGPPTTRDSIYSAEIAKKIHLPWKRIDLGEDYLARYVQTWADLFGGSMHFHGMYQLPFLDYLKTEPPGKIISGFLGDCLGGYTVQFMTRFHKPGEKTYYSRPPGWMFWDAESLKALFKMPVEPALEQVAEEIDRERNWGPGAWFQKLRLFVDWGRQRHFTYFQSMISDYSRGVATPYLNRDYARFSYALPLAALDGRRLQIDMMRRYYPKVMSIPGTYADEPAILTGRYLLKRRLSWSLPPRLTNKWLPEFSSTKMLNSDIVSLQHSGQEGTWPIQETAGALNEWIHLEAIEPVYQSALAGDITSVRKLQSIQAFAYRIKDL